jgi:hypothetical protein
MKLLGERRKKVSPWWNLWALFHMHLMHWKRSEIPIETKIVCFTMELCNKPCNERWAPWAYETVQWNYAMRETHISYQSFTSWKSGGDLKLSIETGLTVRSTMTKTTLISSVGVLAGGATATPPTSTCALLYTWLDRLTRHRLATSLRIAVRSREKNTTLKNKDKWF